MTIREATKLSNGKELDFEYPIILKDKDGNRVYFEDSDGYWSKQEYKDGNRVYFEDSDGDWSKSEHKDGNEVYFENSNGDIIDNRTTEMTVAEIEQKLGHKVKIVKES